MIRVLAVLSALTLAACGADAPPEAPASKGAASAELTLSGCVKAGVASGPAGGGPVRC